MISPRRVNSQIFNQRLKEELKRVEEIKPPIWANFVKSSSHKRRPPEQADFWYMRSASVLRKIYLENQVGVNRLRSFYGGKTKRGYKPGHFRKSGGSVIRKIMQQLEKAGFLEKGKKGRKITPKGHKLLNSVAREVSKGGS